LTGGSVKNVEGYILRFTRSLFTYLGICFLASILLVSIWPGTFLYGETTLNSTEKVLTLEEAVQLAYKYDPDVKKAELAVKEAELIRKEAFDLVTYIPTGGMVDPAYPAGRDRAKGQ
jgi:hypothetical protein